jgi:hypothetical protein
MPIPPIPAPVPSITVTGIRPPSAPTSGWPSHLFNQLLPWGPNLAMLAAISVMSSDSAKPASSEGERGKQKKGKPARNIDQNKKIKDAAREAGLTSDQRRLLGEIVEKDTRGGGADYDYQEIKGIAEEIKAGRSSY